MALAEQQVRVRGKTYNVRVIPGAQSGRHFSIRWEADELDADGAVVQTIYGATDNFDDDSLFANRVKGLLSSGVARASR